MYLSIYKRALRKIKLKGKVKKVWSVHLIPKHQTELFLHKLSPIYLRVLGKGNTFYGVKSCQILEIKF